MSLIEKYKESKYSDEIVEALCKAAGKAISLNYSGAILPGEINVAFPEEDETDAAFIERFIDEMVSCLVTWSRNIKQEQEFNVASHNFSKTKPDKQDAPQDLFSKSVDSTKTKLQHIPKS